MDFQAPTAALAGKKITLSWVAASEADANALKALLPDPGPDGQIDPAALPKTIPGSIRLKPQIRVEGELQAEGTTVSAGDAAIGHGAFTRYGSTSWDETTDQLTAGQQTAIGISAQGLSAVQFETLQTRMQATQALLEQAQAAAPSQREAILQDLTADEITGDLLTGTMWAYLASLQSHKVIAASQSAMIDLPGMSYGLFHAQVDVIRSGFLNQNVSIRPSGVNLDVGHLRGITWVKDDDPTSAINNKPELTANGKTAAQNRWIAYNKSSGQYDSLMEAVVPEEFWLDRSTCSYVDESGELQNPTLPECAKGISTITALGIAQSQGQRIYSVNQDNAQAVLANFPISGDTGQMLRSAIQQGKEVTFHEAKLTQDGWSGYGYSIIDPDTGAGALDVAAAAALLALLGFIGFTSSIIGGLVVGILLTIMGGLFLNKLMEWTGTQDRAVEISAVGFFTTVLFFQIALFSAGLGAPALAAGVVIGALATLAQSFGSFMFDLFGSTSKP